MSKEQAKKHSLDVSHVAAVELPLIVKNVERAIGMLGGQERIKRALDLQFRQLPIQPSSHSVDDRNLELRLRDDPFHHPIQALVNRREKILVKVSIPKQALPADYEQHPNRYTIQELVRRNGQQGGAPYKVEPVAIINKNYTFRAIADFQMSTRNNTRAQEFRQNVLQMRDFGSMRQYYEQKLDVQDEFKDRLMYENREHHLIPPPNFSGIRFPFDFRYQKSPYTVTVRDDTGNVKVVMKSDSKKLFTNTVDYHGDTVPHVPLPEIVAKYSWLLQTDLLHEYSDKKLLDCIHHLRRMFDAKPIWLRKLLLDVTPEALRSAVKEALPYVSYCYKNGPWRFCNVRLGVNPKLDRAHWMYQSEYFRLLRPPARARPRDPLPRSVPPTISAHSPRLDIRVSEDLLFTGAKLPRAINYQVGDITDPDVCAVTARAASDPAAFFRDVPDPQDGWIRRQALETVRQLVRYKLRCLQEDAPFERERICKILATDYTAKEAGGTIDNDGENDIDNDGENDIDNDGENDIDNENDDGDDIDNDNDNDNDNDIDIDIDNDIDNDIDIDEESVYSRIKQVDAATAAKLSALVGLVKQDSLDTSARA